MQENNNEKKNILFQAAAVVFLLLIALAVYHALRPGMGRLAADFFYPYLRISRVAVHAISDQTLLTFTRMELASRLEQQQYLNKTLSLQAAAAAELLRENQTLRNFIGIRPPRNWNYITAEVMLRDPLLWLEQFTIDRGSQDGIQPGDAVLDVPEDGIPVLAGIISSCGKRNSEVITVYNPEFCFSAAIGPKRVIGFINAGSRLGSDGRIPVGYLPPAEEPVPGSAVFTTGFEKQIPGGIKIGELDYLEELNPLFSSANRNSGLIRPAFNPNRLRFVLVVRRDKTIGNQP